MLLEKKSAVIYGAAGAVGSAVARAFAKEGAKLFLTGRRLEPVEKLAARIAAEGGVAEAAQVDALDERAVEEHAGAVAEKAGGIDVSFNAIGIPQAGIQGIPIIELPVDSFSLPIATYTRAHFLTARAAIRRMLEKRSGVILMHTPEPGRLGAPLVGGMGPAWAAMEALSRDLSAEYASQGIRVICLRSTGIPETATIDVVYSLHAKALGTTREQFQALLESLAHTRRQTTLDELTGAAVFAACNLAKGMTGAVANLTGGRVVD
ncbi:MAG TPA: SDR family oxidoreductase [Burkholderiales bacterium]|nr:SDR family oxidoreductase [Burkholderiales bacterium]